MSLNKVSRVVNSSTSKFFKIWILIFPCFVNSDQWAYSVGRFACTNYGAAHFSLSNHFLHFSNMLSYLDFSSLLICVDNCGIAKEKEKKNHPKWPKGRKYAYNFNNSAFWNSFDMICYECWKVFTTFFSTYNAIHIYKNTNAYYKGIQCISTLNGTFSHHACFQNHVTNNPLI